MEAWYCFSYAQPEIKWPSSSDQSNDLLGITCVKLAEKPPDVGETDWYRFWNILKRLHFPY